MTIYNKGLKLKYSKGLLNSEGVALQDKTEGGGDFH